MMWRKTLCEELNVKFQSVFTAEDTLPSVLTRWVGGEITGSILLKQDIGKFLKDLEPYRTHGPDGIEQISY